MTIEKIEVSGYKGFKNKQTILFSKPNGKLGSGITYLTGSNNSGKSSIIEAIKARNGWESPSFSIETRNSNNEEIFISYLINGEQETIKSIGKGSSQTSWDVDKEKRTIFVVPSRRAFSPIFSKGTISRTDYINQQSLTQPRPPLLDNFY